MAKTVKMVAINTIRRGVLKEPGGSEVDPATGRVRFIPAKTDREEIGPGSEFTATEDESVSLIASNAARIATREVPAEPEQVPVAPNTAPRLPASGMTDPPDTERVAADAKEGASNIRRGRA